MQDIRDFTMRGTPGASTIEHYFDIPPHEDINEATMSLSNLTQQSRDSGANRSVPSVLPVASASSAAIATTRIRGHSLPTNSSRHYTPTPTQPQSHSLSPGIGGHNTDYDFFQSLESSFHLDYAPQPRSPFSAANFGVAMGGGGAASAYQELVEHLGFH
jgi:hypothetical protein